MANDLGAASEAVRASIEARLDAVDRLLLGFIPRHERLAIMRGLEDRLRSLAANAPQPVSIVGQADAVDIAGNPLDRPRDPLEELALAAAGEEPVEPRRQTLPVSPPRQALPATIPQRPARVVRPVRPRRSKLALLSTLLGVTAGGLLFATPLVYLAVMAFGVFLGEIGAIIGMGSYVGLILLCSSGAIVTGLVALWRLSQLQPAVVGRGWAISGLCAGPIPFAAASLMAMLFGFQMIEGVGISSVASYPSDGPAAADSPQSGAEPPEDSPAMYGGIVVDPATGALQGVEPLVRGDSTDAQITPVPMYGDAAVPLSQAARPGPVPPEPGIGPVRSPVDAAPVTNHDPAPSNSPIPQSAPSDGTPAYEPDDAPTGA